MITTAQIQQQLSYSKTQGTYPYFQAAAVRSGVPVDLLLAVASRESGIGSNSYYQSHNHVGSDGTSVGIMQLNYAYVPNFITDWAHDDQANINEAARQLAGYLKQFPGNTQAALDAYNAGAGDVQTALGQGKNPDSVTTGGNYASDILQRKTLLDGILYPTASGNAVSIFSSGTGGKATKYVLIGTLFLTGIIGFIHYQNTKEE